MQFIADESQLIWHAVVVWSIDGARTGGGGGGLTCLREAYALGPKCGRSTQQGQQYAHYDVLHGIHSSLFFG
jgi:hypothetical protein